MALLTEVLLVSGVALGAEGPVLRASRAVVLLALAALPER